MSLISLLILIVVVGFALYLLNFAPIDGTMKQIIKAIAILVVIVLAIKALVPLVGLG